MTKLKNVSYRGSQKYVEALSEIAQNQGQTLAQFVESAVKARVEAIGASLPASKARQGVRSDVIPRGWKSRLYKDMYQLVCIFEPSRGFEVGQYHEWKGDTPKGAYTDVIQGQKVEMYPIGVDKMDSDYYHDMALAVAEWITEQGL